MLSLDVGGIKSLLCLSLVLLIVSCAPTRYQRAEVVNLHLHNNGGGEIPIVDTYLRIRVDHLIYIGDCGDVKHLTLPKEWSVGNSIEVSLKKTRFSVKNPSGKDYACDILGKITAK
jgi:hypothetical protein